MNEILKIRHMDRVGNIQRTFAQFLHSRSIGPETGGFLLRLVEDCDLPPGVLVSLQNDIRQHIK